MSASHRRFGDLLEEGIKRVHIIRKKPIGYILDEFGYELRPDDSSKGRYALGHWYYKKRIPASMEDVTKLARLIVSNSDVDRDWLKAFLDSAGFAESDKFCDQFFLTSPPVKEVAAPTPPEKTQIIQQAIGESSHDEKPAMYKRSWLLYTSGAFVVLVGLSFFLWNGSFTSGSVVSTNTISPATSGSIFPTSPAALATETITVPPTVTLLPMTATPDFAAFDGKCPTDTSTLAFEYTSPQSFREFLNDGGSFIALQSGFNALIQKKAHLHDGRVVSSDLNGDGIPEVIISAILEKGSIWQILGCHSGRYQALADLTDPDLRYLRFAVDLNGNQLPEIVSYRQTQVDTTQLFEFSVQEWNGHQIADLLDNSRFEQVGRHLPSDITDWRWPIANATGTTQDTNGDGLYELVITGGLVTPVPTCDTRFERQFTETWAWNGKSLQLAERVYVLPIYRFQRSADGDLAFALNELDLALNAYQDVLFDVDLYRRDQYRQGLEYCRGIGPRVDPAFAENEPDQLKAYARWRILLINTIQGAQDAMQVVYQTLQDKFPEGKAGHSYAVIASAFWESFQTTQDMDAACAAANLAAKSQILYPSHKAENICFIP